MKELGSYCPATPSTTKSSPVNVPVLSKQAISTLPAYGIRNGSVQKIANLDNAASEVFTARDNSMGNSGGTTLVMIKMQSNSNLERFLSTSTPICQICKLRGRYL